MVITSIITSLLVISYYMMSRLFIVYYWSKTRPNFRERDDSNWIIWGFGDPEKDALPIPGAVFPLSGEVWLFITLMVIFAVQPMKYAGNIGRRVSKKQESRVKELERHQTNLDELECRIAKYGLTSEDMLKYSWMEEFEKYDASEIYRVGISNCDAKKEVG
jgi:hypothetical protein